jgi:apolipoprotein N-acyltransferase
VTSAPRRRRAPGLLAAIGGGALLGASFQPWGHGALALVAVVPLLVALAAVAADPAARLRRAFFVAYAFGFALFAAMVHWILFLSAHELPNRSVMIPLFLLMVAYLALYPGLFGLALVAAARRTRVPIAWLAPPIWIASEWLRGAGELGFPWGEVGYSLATLLPMAQAAAWVGVSGLSLLALATNASIAAALASRARGRWLAPAAAAGVLAAVYLGGQARLAAHPRAERGGVTAAVLQPNIEQGIKWDYEYKERSFDAAVRLSRRWEPGAVDLAVWPETAVPAYLHDEPAYFEIVKRAVRESGAPALLGFPDTELRGEERHYYNAAIFLRADGSEAGGYRKMHLVPFGEAIPFQFLFPALRNVDFGEADFTPGERADLFSVDDGGGPRFGVTICFEAIFPEMTRDLARRGADLLVNITNDAWFGRSSACWQHARMAVVRSIEAGVAQIRSANTGISLVADPMGRVLAQTEIFEEDVLIVSFDPKRVPTAYVAWGDVCRRGSLIVTALALLASLLPVPFLSRR